MTRNELTKKRRAENARLRASYAIAMKGYFRPLPTSEDCITVNATTGEVTFGANVTPEQILAFELRELGIH